MAKSPDAFRTISEVAEWLGIQAHVLRFWESKFTQVKPIKRAGGRRYYRPGDMLLLGGIKKLLHDDGLTIKGVQKILREQGMSHVSDLSAPLDDDTLSQLDEDITPKPDAVLEVVEAEEETGVVLNFETPAAEEPGTTAPAEDAKPAAPAAQTRDGAQDAQFKPDRGTPTVDPLETTAKESQVEPEAPKAALVPPVEAPVAHEPDQKVASEPDASGQSSKAADAEEPAPTADLPAFLRKPLADTPKHPEATATPVPEEAPAAPDSEPMAAEPAPTAPETPGATPAAPKPRIIDLPLFPNEDSIEATPGVLAAAYALTRIAPADAREIDPLLAQLTALRDRMSASRRNTSTPHSQG